MALRPVRGRMTTPSRPWGGVQPVYEDIRPISEWQQDEESAILLLFLPGFLRQHLKVTTEGKTIVRVRGERLVAGNKWSRFQENYQVPERCNIMEIRARFEGGILIITMPWKKNNQAQESSKEAGKATPSMEVPPKNISSPDNQNQQMSPPKASLVPKPEKVADDIPPRVLNPPLIPAGSADKGKYEKLVSESQTQKGRDEQRNRSPEPETVARMPSIKDGVERKEISTETKAKPAKLESVEKSIEETEDKQGIQKSKEVVDDQAEKEKLEEIEEKVEYEGQEEEESEGQEEEESEGQEEEEKVEYEGQEEEEKVEYEGQEEEPTTNAAALSSIGYGLGKYKEAAKSLAELNEERKSLVNIGVAVLVIVALGTYISCNIGSGKA